MKNWLGTSLTHSALSWKGAMTFAGIMAVGILAQTMLTHGGAQTAALLVGVLKWPVAAITAHAVAGHLKA